MHMAESFEGAAALVRPCVFLGSAASARDAHFLREHHVTHVLCVGGRIPSVGGKELPAQATREAVVVRVIPLGSNSATSGGSSLFSVTVRALDCEDDEMEDMLGRGLLSQGADFIDLALASQGGVVLVHCLAGISRSATVVAAWLMRREQGGLETVLKDIQSRRRGVWPNRGFQKQLRVWEACGYTLDTSHPSFLRLLDDRSRLARRRAEVAQRREVNWDDWAARARAGSERGGPEWQGPRLLVALSVLVIGVAAVTARRWRSFRSWQV